MKDPTLKRTQTMFLQAVVILIGVGTLAALLYEPQIEGVNAHATQFQIYFADPFLAYIYLGSIPFFVALTQAFMLLQHISQNKTFSQESVKTLRTIKFCGVIQIFFILGAELFIMMNHGSDDPAGAYVMGMFAMFVSAIISTAAAVFEKLLRSAVAMKQENDFTI